MPRIEAVLFDFDDTLIDWSQQAHSGSEIYRRHMDNVYQHLQAQSVILPEREILFRCYQDTIIRAWEEAKKTWAGVSFCLALQQTFAAFAIDLDDQMLDEVLHAFDWQPVPGVTLYVDTIETLSALRTQGYKIGLVTNSMMPMWMRDVELQAYQILEYFDARVTSGDVGYMKPHPAIYEYILDQLGVSPQQAVFVGDRPENDIAGANAVGLISVMMSPPHLQHNLDKIRPNFTIKQLHELLPILAALESEVHHEQTGAE